MAPNSSSPTGVLFEDDVVDYEGVSKPSVAAPREWQIVWRNVALFTFLHLSALYGLALILTGGVMWQTLAMSLIVAIVSLVSITTGSHRLWSHKSYKAKTPLKILLVILNCMAFQEAVIHWARDHRMHHKYSDTDADPTNASRGFFFAHMGWLLVKKHPDINAKSHTIDFSDLYSEPILVFQKKYYLILMPLFCFVLPTVIPMYFWGESFVNSYFVTSMLRYATSLHFTWLVNSAAHLYGTKPYDQHIKPTESGLLIPFLIGEGFHNYHHTFPWDYKASELGYLNITKNFIDFCAMIGWAYDLKTAPVDVIEKRVQRTGDGTHSLFERENKHQPKVVNEKITKDE